MKTRMYMDVRFDVTDLTEDERGALALEVAVQSEESDGDPQDGNYHSGVPEPEIEWNEVEEEEDDLGSDIVRADLLRIANRLAADIESDTSQGDASDLLAAARWIENRFFADGDWAVGKIGENMIRVSSKQEAEAAIAGAELVDPEGVAQGMYFIDPPGNENEGPGESSIYSGAARERPSPALRDHATGGTGQEAPRPGASDGASETGYVETSYVLTVCLDGIPEGRDYHAIEETIEATGEAMCRFEEEPTKIVTLLLSDKNQEYRAGQAPHKEDTP